jgi:hypothetical protein
MPGKIPFKLIHYPASITDRRCPLPLGIPRPALRSEIAAAALGELGIGGQAGARAGVGAGVGARGQLALHDPFGRAVEETDAGRPGGEGARGRKSGLGGHNI